METHLPDVRHSFTLMSFLFAPDGSELVMNTNFPPATSSLLRDQGGAGQALGGAGEAEGEHDEAEQALPGHTQRAGEV